MMQASMFLVAGCIGVACACIFSYLWQGSERREGYRSAVGVCTLVLVLAGCGGAPQTSNPPKQKTVTPQATTKPQTATPGTVVAQGEDWPTYHHDATRTGYLPGERDPGQLVKSWSGQLDGAVYAEPLVVNGMVIVATEGDSLYALDAKTGQIKWQTHVGMPQPQSALPCGDIDPLGITGTPVYDPATKLIFAIAEIQGPQHVIVGLDAMTGQVKIRRSADVEGRDPTPYQQRAALLVSQSMVYWTYGGLAGDCGQYIGTVMAMATNGQGSLLTYQVPTPREGGIWAPAGPAADDKGNIYVAVGNGETTQGDWDHSDSVLRLSPTLKLEDGFAPQQWQQENSQDTDLGSMGPTLLPNGIVFIAGKSSQGYTLHANALGGVGGQIQVAQVCDGLAMGGTASVGMTVIVPCTGGLQQVLVGADGKMTMGWHVGKPISMPPVVGGRTVYSLDSNGTLYALNANTGTVRAQVALGQAPARFATPTISGGRIFVGTQTGVVAVNIS